MKELNVIRNLLSIMKNPKTLDLTSNIVSMALSNQIMNLFQEEKKNTEEI